MSVYFDYAATAPMPDAVRDAYIEALATVGNPSSQHAHGQASRELQETARESIAKHLKVSRDEIIFTSGGTESVNLALKGLYLERNKTAKRPVVLASQGEHHATIESATFLEDFLGAEIVWLPLDEFGFLSPSVLESEIAKHGAENIALASVLWVNNEIGTVQDIPALNSVCDTAGVPLHVDAVAALGIIDIGAVSPKPAALSLSAHKIGGAVSSGALVLRRDQKITPLIHGGSQQRGRSGTGDAAIAVAFAKALDLAHPNEEKLNSLKSLQSRLIDGIRRVDPSAVLRGPVPGDTRAANNVHFTFPGTQGDSLTFLLDMAGFSVSTGSACTAGVTEISHVMRSIGLPDEIGIGAIRFTFGAQTTEAEIDALLAALPDALEAARKAGITSVLG